jgi:hypothetical protein
MQQDWRKTSLGLFALLAVLVIVGTLALDFLLSRSVARDRASSAAVEREIGSLQVALADFRTAQAGYVAATQMPDVWVRRASDLSTRLESGLTQLRESASTESTRSGYEAALATLANLASLDKKARAYMQDDQRFLAADVVFVESQEGSQRLASDLEQLRALQSAQADDAITRTGWLRFGATTLAMGVVLAVALRVGKPPVSAASGAALTAQMIRDLPPPVKPAAPVARPLLAAPAPLPALPPAPAPPVTTLNLPDAAELCVDLARVMDGRDVPALLERVARVLDAKGVIVWMVDAAGGVLHPSLSHGYTEKVLNRLGTLEVDSDNVTSLAFRSVRPQIMAGASPGAAGAVAVPLVTAAGCSGVLAAELRDSQPAPELLALTRIVAAQFATLIAPADLHGARAAEA